MSLGQILLQPQKLQRARQRAPESAALDDLVALAILVVADGAQGGPLPGLLAQAAEDAVAKMAQQAAAGASSAAGRLTTLFQPLFTQIQNLLQSPLGEPGAAADKFLQTLAVAIAGLRNLSTAQLRTQLQEVFGIVEHDLGFTPDFVEQTIWGLFDGMVASLQQPPQGETPEQRVRRRETAAILQRLKRDAQPGFKFPHLDADRAAQSLLALLKRPDIDSALSRAACVGQASATAFHLGINVTDLLAPAPGANPQSSTARSFAAPLDAPAAQQPPIQIAYYATKLLNTQNWDGDWGELPAAIEPKLTEGYLSSELRDAFRPLSIVLSNCSFLITNKEHEEWTVTDRKQYVVTLEGGKLTAVPRIEVSESDFVKNATGDFKELRKLLRNSGLVLTSKTIGVTHIDGSNTWELDDGEGGHRFHGVSVKGTITLFALSPPEIVFDIPADLQSDLAQKHASDALVNAFKDHGIWLSPRTRISPRDGGDAWNLDDGEFEFHIKSKKGKLLVDTGGFFGWLFSTVGWPPMTEKVWINQARTEVLLGHRILHTGDAVTWQNTPKFNKLAGNSYYSFAKLQPDAIEDWARVTSWVQDLLNALMYSATIGVAIGDGTVKYVFTSNFFNYTSSISDMVAKLTARRSISDLIGIDSQTWLFDWGWWYDFLVYLGIKGIGAVESLAGPSSPDTPGASTFSTFVDKVLNAILGVKTTDTYWVALAYEAVLSFLTLYNHQEPTDAKVERPENFKENGGFIAPFWNLGLLIYCAAVPAEEYALPFQTVDLTLYRWLFGVLGLGAVTGFLGWIVGQMVVAGAGFTADPKEMAKSLAKSWGKSTGYFFPFLKLVKGKAT